MGILSFESKYPNFTQELDHEDQILFPDCAYKIMTHLDKNIATQTGDHDLVGKLLTFRWLLQKNLNMTNN
ncbi:MAG: hypothetical protein JXR03_08320 [Cyclobacteriaceae bacterium]